MSFASSAAAFDRSNFAAGNRNATCPVKGRGSFNGRAHASPEGMALSPPPHTLFFHSLNSN